LDICKSFACSSPPHAGHIPKSLSVLFACSTSILPYFISPLPFFSFSLFCCLVIDISTIFTPAPLPLVLAEGAASTVFARAPLPLVLAEAAASAFAFSLSPLVLAESAAPAVFAIAPHAERATAAVLHISHNQLNT